MIEIRDGSHIWVRPENIANVSIVIIGKPAPDMNIKFGAAEPNLGASGNADGPLPGVPISMNLGELGTRIFQIHVRLQNGSEAITLRLDHKSEAAAVEELTKIIAKIHAALGIAS